MKIIYDCPKLRIGIPPRSRKRKQVWSTYQVELNISEFSRDHIEEGLRLLDKVHVNVPGTEFIFIDGQCYRDLSDIDKPSEYETLKAIQSSVTGLIVSNIRSDIRYTADASILESNLTNALSVGSISGSLPSVHYSMSEAPLGDDLPELEHVFDKIANDVIESLVMVDGKLFTPCKEPMHAVVMLDTAGACCLIELDDEINDRNAVMPKIALFPISKKDEALDFATNLARSMCHHPARLEEWHFGRIEGGFSYRDDIHELNKRLACRNLANVLAPQGPDTLVVKELLMHTPTADIEHYRLLKIAEALPVSDGNAEIVQDAIEQSMDYLQASRPNDPRVNIVPFYKDLLSRTEPNMSLSFKPNRP